MTRTIKMLDTGEVVEVGALAGDALVQLGRAVAYVAPVVPELVSVEAAPIVTRKRSKSKPALEAAKPAAGPKAGGVESLKGRV